MSETTVERTVKLATIVPTLTDAWAFVMTHIDELGDAPRILISPIWASSTLWNDVANGCSFEVSVSGMTETKGEQ